MLRDLDALSASDIRWAYEQAVQWFVASAARVPADAWTQHAMDRWTVRELVAHTSRSLDLVTKYLDAASGPVTILGRTGFTRLVFANPTPTLHRDVAERARETADALGPDIVMGVWRLGDDVLNRLATTPDDAPCTTHIGTLSLIDYLPSRVGELVVHTLDLYKAMDWSTDDAPALPIEVTLSFVAALADPVKAILALSGRIGYDVFS